MKLILFTALSILIGCKEYSENNNFFDHTANLNQLIDTYVFLSSNHDLLHIMMGEHEGSPFKSYKIFQNKINDLNDNYYIKPIQLGLSKIKVNDKNLLENADKFDALIDYYQIGIQMIIEGILKGYGYNRKMPQNTNEYLAIKKINFNKKIQN